ncbi:MAG: DMT family transporter [Ilumatobacter sp.]|nr:DMT family transporter [Ilumatobacter sp.]
MIRAVARAFNGEGELTERQGAVLVAGAGVAFSVTAIAYRGVDEASEFEFLTFRGLSTAAAMVALILVRRGRRPVVFSGVTWRAWLAALVLAATSMLYILALERTSAATTLFLLAAAPVFAAIIGWLALRERVEPSTIVAIGATAVGVVIMVGAGLETGTALGLLFAALIPVLLGLYSVVLRSASGVDPVIPTLLAGTFLALAAGTVAFAQAGLAVSGRDFAMATISGGIALGIGLPLFNLGHRSVAAARIPLLLMTEVVLAPLWVWIWPGETPTIATLVGGAVIMGAVVGLMLRTRPEAVPPAVIAPT